MPDTITPVNVVVLPSDAVLHKAHALSDIINGSTNRSTINYRRVRLPPLHHLTLHQCAIVGSAEELANRLSRALTGNDNRPIIQLPGIISTFAGTGLFWDTHITEELRSLHNAIVTVMNNMRQWHLLPHHLQMWQKGAFTAAERQSLSLTGSPLAAETFRPHITIGNLRSIEDMEGVQAELTAESVQPMEFSFSQIHITDIGDFGTITRILKSITL